MSTIDTTSTASLLLQALQAGEMARSRRKMRELEREQLELQKSRIAAEESNRRLQDQIRALELGLRIDQLNRAEAARQLRAEDAANRERILRSIYGEFAPGASDWNVVPDGTVETDRTEEPTVPLGSDISSAAFGDGKSLIGSVDPGLLRVFSPPAAQPEQSQPIPVAPQGTTVQRSAIPFANVTPEQFALLPQWMQARIFNERNEWNRLARIYENAARNGVLQYLSPETKQAMVAAGFDLPQDVWDTRRPSDGQNEKLISSVSDAVRSPEGVAKLTLVMAIVDQAGLQGDAKQAAIQSLMNLPQENVQSIYDRVLQTKSQMQPQVIDTQGLVSTAERNLQAARTRANDAQENYLKAIGAPGKPGTAAVPPPQNVFELGYLNWNDPNKSNEKSRRAATLIWAWSDYVHATIDLLRQQKQYELANRQHQARLRGEEFSGGDKADDSSIDDRYVEWGEYIVRMTGIKEKKKIVQYLDWMLRRYIEDKNKRAEIITTVIDKLGPRWIPKE